MKTQMSGLSVLVQRDVGLTASSWNVRDRLVSDVTPRFNLARVRRVRSERIDDFGRCPGPHCQ